MRPTVSIEFRTPQQANAFAIWFDEKPDEVSVEFDDDMSCPCHEISVL